MNAPGYLRVMFAVTDIDDTLTSAKEEETRKKRLDSLIAYSAEAESIPQFTWKKAER